MIIIDILFGFSLFMLMLVVGSAVVPSIHLPSIDWSRVNPRTLPSRINITYKPDKTKAYAWEPDVVWNDESFPHPDNKNETNKMFHEWWMQKMEGLTGAWEVREQWEATERQLRDMFRTQGHRRPEQEFRDKLREVEERFLDVYRDLMGMPELKAMPSYTYKTYAPQTSLAALPEGQQIQQRLALPAPKANGMTVEDIAKVPLRVTQNKPMDYIYLAADGTTMHLGRKLAHDEEQQQGARFVRSRRLTDD